jgi:uncharacterized protein (TIGR02001 family)
MIRHFDPLQIPASRATLRHCSGQALLCLAAASVLNSPVVDAADGLTWGGSLSLTSDYVYRGLSQTEGRPTLQGGVHVHNESGWSAGLWASSVNRGAAPGADTELDLQLSKAWSLNQDWSLLLNANHYFYPDDNRAQPYEYDELAASLSYQNRLTATVSWSPNTSRFSRDVFVKNRTARSYELTVLQPVTPAWSLFGGVGHYDLKDLFDTGYWYWSVGASYCVGKLQVDLSNIDTDHTAKRLFDYEVSKRQWIAALSWRF